MTRCLLAALAISEAAWGQSPPEGQPEGPPAAELVEPEAEEEPHRVTLSLRAFGGVAWIDGEHRAGLGGNLLVGLPLADTGELELSVGMVASDKGDLLGVAEIIFKWVFERGGSLHPHVVLGPALSLDLEDSLSVSGGLLVGGGGVYWFSPRFGWSGELGLRVLFGAESQQILTLGTGPSLRF